MVQECGHVKNGGGKCASPALRGKSYCHFHNPARLSVKKAKRARYFLELPLLEFPGAVQAAVSIIGQVLYDNQIFDRPAARLLYALQFAIQQQDGGCSAASARPPLPPVVKITRTPGFQRIYSTAKLGRLKGQAIKAWEGNSIGNETKVGQARPVEAVKKGTREEIFRSGPSPEAITRSESTFCPQVQCLLEDSSAPR